LGKTHETSPPQILASGRGRYREVPHSLGYGLPLRLRSRNDRRTPRKPPTCCKTHVGNPGPIADATFFVRTRCGARNSLATAFVTGLRPRGYHGSTRVFEIIIGCRIWSERVRGVACAANTGASPAGRDVGCRQCCPHFAASQRHAHACQGIIQDAAYKRAVSARWRCDGARADERYARRTLAVSRHGPPARAALHALVDRREWHPAL
jgi:hypothetical protein